MIACHAKNTALERGTRLRASRSLFSVVCLELEEMKKTSEERLREAIDAERKRVEADLEEKNRQSLAELRRTRESRKIEKATFKAMYRDIAATSEKCLYVQAALADAERELCHEREQLKAVSETEMQKLSSSLEDMRKQMAFQAETLQEEIRQQREQANAERQSHASERIRQEVGRNHNDAYVAVFTQEEIQRAQMSHQKATEHISSLSEEVERSAFEIAELRQTLQRKDETIDDLAKRAECLDDALGAAEELGRRQCAAARQRETEMAHRIEEDRERLTRCYEAEMEQKLGKCLSIPPSVRTAAAWTWQMSLPPSSTSAINWPAKMEI